MLIKTASVFAETGGKVTKGCSKRGFCVRKHRRYGSIPHASHAVKIA